jgi:MFS family permease
LEDEDRGNPAVMLGAMAETLPGSIPEKSVRKGATVALLLLTGLNLFNYLDRYILPGVQPLVQKEFGVNDERMGALTYAFFITYMIAAPLTGWLGDRFPRKPLLVAGAVLWSLLTLLTSTVHSYNALYSGLAKRPLASLLRRCSLISIPRSSATAS